MVPAWYALICLLQSRVLMFPTLKPILEHNGATNALSSLEIGLYQQVAKVIISLFMRFPRALETPTIAKSTNGISLPCVLYMAMRSPAIRKIKASSMTVSVKESSWFPAFPVSTTATAEASSILVPSTMDSNTNEARISAKRPACFHLPPQLPSKMPTFHSVDIAGINRMASTVSAIVPAMAPR